jgi:hypothetical protein
LFSFRPLLSWRKVPLRVALSEEHQPDVKRGLGAHSIQWLMSIQWSWIISVIQWSHSYPK